MKKIVLSVLCGFMIVGSAFALPSPEDRKALCEKQPDKFVWVAENEACVPINPCLSNINSIVSAYCSSIYLIKDEEQAEIILKRYVERWFHTSVTSFVEAGRDDDGHVFLGAKTSSGGYFVIEFAIGELNLWYNVRKIYDYQYEQPESSVIRYDDNTNYYDNNGWLIVKKDLTKDLTKTECTDFVDFAALLSGDLIDYAYNDGQCVVFTRDDGRNNWKAFVRSNK